jgi:hypothetical protein
MFSQFRAQYPQGSIKTELLAQKVDGMHVFRVAIADGELILSTATAADSDLEVAEDRAVKRGLILAGISLESETRIKATLLTSAQRFELREALTDHLSDRPSDLLREQTREFSNEQSRPALREAIRDEPREQLRDQSREQQKDEPKAESRSESKPMPRFIPESPQIYAPASSPVSSNLSPNISPSPIASNNVFEDRQPERQPERQDGLQTDLINQSELDLVVSEPIPLKETKILEFSDAIAQTNVELMRLGWNEEKGREYLMRTYKKNSRSRLTPEEINRFLAYLKSQTVEHPPF